MIEMGISIISACLPAMWPLINTPPVERLFHSVFSAFSLLSPLRSLSQHPDHSHGTSHPFHYEHYKESSDTIPLESRTLSTREGTSAELSSDHVV